MLSQSHITVAYGCQCLNITVPAVMIRINQPGKVTLVQTLAFAAIWNHHYQIYNNNVIIVAAVHSCFSAVANSMATALKQLRTATNSCTWYVG